jgi:hypothetical protein
VLPKRIKKKRVIVDRAALLARKPFAAVSVHTYCISFRFLENIHVVAGVCDGV